MLVMERWVLREIGTEKYLPISKYKMRGGLTWEEFVTIDIAPPYLFETKRKAIILAGRWKKGRWYWHINQASANAALKKAGAVVASLGTPKGTCVLQPEAGSDRPDTRIEVIRIAIYEEGGEWIC